MFRGLGGVSIGCRSTSLLLASDEVVLGVLGMEFVVWAGSGALVCLGATSLRLRTVVSPTESFVGALPREAVVYGAFPTTGMTISSRTVGVSTFK